MSHEIEREHTYLLNGLPKDIANWHSEFLADTYIPADSENPQIRLRQRGGAYFITKKYPKNPGDLSEMIEESITLSKNEYEYMMASVPGKYIAKQRYKRVFDGVTVEIDAYQEKLFPLLVIDFEWIERAPSKELLNQFDLGKEITQTDQLAGGQLAGKAYDDIVQHI